MDERAGERERARGASGRGAFRGRAAFEKALVRAEAEGTLPRIEGDPDARALRLSWPEPAVEVLLRDEGEGLTVRVRSGRDEARAYLLRATFAAGARPQGTPGPDEVAAEVSFPRPPGRARTVFLEALGERLPAVSVRLAFGSRLLPTPLGAVDLDGVLLAESRARCGARRWIEESGPAALVDALEEALSTLVSEVADPLASLEPKERARLLRLALVVSADPSRSLTDAAAEAAGRFAGERVGYEGELGARPLGPGAGYVVRTARFVALDAALLAGGDPPAGLLEELALGLFGLALARPGPLVVDLSAARGGEEEIVEARLGEVEEDEERARLVARCARMGGLPAGSVERPGDDRLEPGALLTARRERFLAVAGRPWPERVLPHVEWALRARLAADASDSVEAYFVRPTVVEAPHPAAPPPRRVERRPCTERTERVEPEPPPAPVARPREVFLDDGVVRPLLRGDSDTSGVASGRLAFSAAAALRLHRAGAPVVLAARRDEDEVQGLAVARALLVVEADPDEEEEDAPKGRLVRVAQRLGLPTVRLARGRFRLDREGGALQHVDEGCLLVREGDPITVDAAKGRVYFGRLSVPLPGGAGAS